MEMPDNLRRSFCTTCCSLIFSSLSVTRRDGSLIYGVSLHVCDRVKKGEKIWATVVGGNQTTQIVPDVAPQKSKLVVNRSPAYFNWGKNRMIVLAIDENGVCTWVLKVHTAPLT